MNIIKGFLEITSLEKLKTLSKEDCLKVKDLVIYKEIDLGDVLEEKLPQFENLEQLSWNPKKKKVVIKNLLKLTMLDIGGSTTEEIIFENLPSLEDLLIGCPLTKELDLSTIPSIESIDIGNTKLQSLDISKNKKLISVSCCDNPFGVNVDFSNNPYIDEIINSGTLEPIEYDEDEE
ncbi:MAG: hypothetical protein ACRC4L_02055 [Mycoplasma sp.]